MSCTPRPVSVFPSQVRASAQIRDVHRVCNKAQRTLANTSYPNKNDKTALIQTDPSLCSPSFPRERDPLFLPKQNGRKLLEKMFFLQLLPGKVYEATSWKAEQIS